MEIYTLPLGSYMTNCYLVSGKPGACVVIDPGFEPELVLAALKKRELTPEAILLTHGHFDHVGAVLPIREKYGCPVYLAPEDLNLPAYLTLPVGATTDVEEGDVLELAGISFRVLHTPGHTEGSVCYLTENALFCGDTLFEGSCGRTDLPGGSIPKMLDSLRRLRELDFAGGVFTGHGGSTTLAKERQSNPYLMEVPGYEF